MRDGLTYLEDFSPDPLSDVEDLLRLAKDELPVVRSGLKTEIVTRAQKDQRELRCQHVLWGAVTMLLISLGALLYWPLHSPSPTSSGGQHSQKPISASLLPTADAVDWDLVESKTRLRERNLEILQDAF
jgi:hypothetical protein